MKKSTTSWGRVAKWYDDLLSKEGTYQKDVILPSLLKLMQIKKGEKILDLACGSGFFSREFYKKGAMVTGTDISEELIELAREHSPKEITFKVAPADKQTMIKDGSMDKVVIVLALQNIESLEKTLAECHRVLKPHGTLHLILNHPTFRIPQASEWGWSGHEVQYRRIDGYLTPFSTHIQMHPGDDPSERTVSFHRPLSMYIKALRKNGLVVSNMEEWISHKHSDSGPRAKAENIARQEIPLFLYLEATKL